ncbi:hypothetical protein C480_20244 [Natrialba aegyptia DSM 13077]|uniref:Uncharacterized protein n=1 Tax=Natrialba aegyptia DSM 13077 TaxID=1227491 RepID=M0ALP8_9EURY|nr:hypothetical protein C480_20244 [Natrialba aegyptia DSM 13077]
MTRFHKCILGIAVCPPDYVTDNSITDLELLNSIPHGINDSSNLEAGNIWRGWSIGIRAPTVHHVSEVDS